ncbi:hypothetical protein [Kitasatospora sp. MAP5-34]|uniref:hypothetical protein n=1 Tax=Kitasatospora sp. MAP5-34 TaxID=3035102 RepID=UPI0024732D20|nr:hypothetical protein [Kitasatospora sp. MAP5-34]
MGSSVEQPEPVPGFWPVASPHAASDQPRAGSALFLVSVVPPTAVTYGEAAGYEVP